MGTQSWVLKFDKFIGALYYTQPSICNLFWLPKSVLCRKLVTSLMQQPCPSIMYTISGQRKVYRIWFWLRLCMCWEGWFGLEICPWEWVWSRWLPGIRSRWSRAFVSRKGSEHWWFQISGSWTSTWITPILLGKSLDFSWALFSSHTPHIHSRPKPNL